MYYITQKGSGFLSEGPEEASLKQKIARKHLKLLVRGKKNDPKAKALRDKYRELEGERVRRDELSIPSWARDAVGDAGVSLGIKLALKGGKYLWNKAKGHNLSRVKVPKEMTADQKERAYKRFKRTASGKSLKEARGDKLKKLAVPTIPDEHSSPKYKKKTTTKTYKRRQAEVRSVIRKRGHPDAAKEADLLRMRRNRGVQWRTMRTLTPNQRSVLDVQNRGQVRPDTPW